MIITDINANVISIEELVKNHERLGVEYEINDGKIVGSVYEKSTATDGESEQC